MRTCWRALAHGTEAERRPRNSSLSVCPGYPLPPRVEGRCNLLARRQSTEDDLSFLEDRPLSSPLMRSRVLRPSPQSLWRSAVRACRTSRSGALAGASQGILDRSSSRKNSRTASPGDLDLAVLAVPFPVNVQHLGLRGDPHAVSLDPSPESPHEESKSLASRRPDLECAAVVPPPSGLAGR